MKLTKNLKLTAILLILSVLVGCTPAATSSTEASASSQTIASSSVVPPVSSKAPVSSVPPVSSQPSNTSSETASKPEYNLQLTTEDLMIYARYPTFMQDIYINADGQLRFTDKGRKKVSNPEKYEQLKDVISIGSLGGERHLYDACFALQADGTATVIYYDLFEIVGTEPSLKAGENADYYAEIQKFLDGKKFKDVQQPYFLTTDGDYYRCDYYRDADGILHRDQVRAELLASDVVYADQNVVLLKDGRVAEIFNGKLKYIEDKEWTNIVQIAKNYFSDSLLGLRADGSVVTWTGENFNGRLINQDAVVKALIPGTDEARTADDRIIRLALSDGETEPKEYPTCSPEALAVYTQHSYELLPNGTLQPIRWQDLDSDREILDWNKAFGGSLTTCVWENE